jgi:hypothetical protein
MIVSLRDAAIASVVAAVASTSVMAIAQTSVAISSQPPPPVVTSPSPPPTTNQFSSNELIGTGSRFFGGVSHGLATIIEKAVSQWGLPIPGSHRWGASNNAANAARITNVLITRPSQAHSNT